ncbi:hypothetical protein COU60_02190 [Candidatus Pacearchaeota archaeon CG10_big_fil_rev_8_21_14_0_10_34_76]|nr:MAG: hypothetical protein COU60_02190 [Candidatus Pacearchaeota archaeon CG10_big_fil_rev_8_21_14_0_10_34_76]
MTTHYYGKIFVGVGDYSIALMEQAERGVDPTNSAFEEIVSAPAGEEPTMIHTKTGLERFSDRYPSWGNSGRDF